MHKNWLWHSVDSTIYHVLALRVAPRVVPLELPTLFRHNLRQQLLEIV